METSGPDTRSVLMIRRVSVSRCLFDPALKWFILNIFDVLEFFIIFFYM